MIHQSIDWNFYESDLIKKSLNLKHSGEIRQMILNIRPLIEQLSIAEVEARQGKRQKAKDILSNVNENIQLVEEYLLIAAILG